MYTFRRIVHSIKNFLHQPKHILSPRGRCFCHYCINKYLNGKDVDSVEEYENVISEKYNFLIRTSMMKAFRETEIINGEDKGEFTEARARAYAALQVIVNMLYECPNSVREEIYATIEDYHYRMMVRTMVDKGIVVNGSIRNNSNL